MLGAKHAHHLSKAGWVRTDGTVGNCLTTEALCSQARLSGNCSGSRGLQVADVEGEEFVWMIALEPDKVSLGLLTARNRRLPLDVLAC